MNNISWGVFSHFDDEERSFTTEVLEVDMDTNKVISTDDNPNIWTEPEWKTFSVEKWERLKKVIQDHHDQHCAEVREKSATRH